MGKWQTSTGLVRTLTVPSHGPVQRQFGILVAVWSARDNGKFGSTSNN